MTQYMALRNSTFLGMPPSVGKRAGQTRIESDCDSSCVSKISKNNLKLNIKSENGVHVTPFLFLKELALCAVS